MASPQSVSLTPATAPTAPQAATDADDAKPGQNQDVTNSGSKTGGAGSSVPINGGGPSHKQDSDENKNKTSWIELQLVYDSNGLPVVGMAYEVTLPDGTTIASGSTDDQGAARVDKIDPGSCQISFPTLDKEAWVDA